MDLGNPPLEMKDLLEPSPLRSILSLRERTVPHTPATASGRGLREQHGQRRAEAAPLGTTAFGRGRCCRFRRSATRSTIAHYEYMALAKKTSVFEKNSVSFVEPRRFGVNDNKSVPRRVRRHV